MVSKPSITDVLPELFFCIFSAKTRLFDGIVLLQ